MLAERNLSNFLDGTYASAEGERAVASISDNLALGRDFSHERVLRALAACLLGARAESVAKLLSWKEFESFCGLLLRARGYDVTENITLTKPRAQVDILARSSSVALAVDCKHWARSAGNAAMLRIAGAQSARALLLRKRFRQLEPLLSVIIVFADESARFVEGTAVVPLFTLASFLENLPEYRDNLTFY